MNQRDFMSEAIRLSIANVESGTGGPFGAVIVRDSEIIARGANLVTSSHDPTAHAEIVAIREACEEIGDYQLTGCEIYCSCEPCPMCLGAIYWARLEAIYFGNCKKDAAEILFDDHFIYQEIEKSISDRRLPTRQMMRKEAQVAFEKWTASDSKVEY
jgi:tRNA(Arg) A34 adenosine deaminase TadA